MTSIDYAALAEIVRRGERKPAYDQDPDVFVRALTIHSLADALDELAEREGK